MRVCIYDDDDECVGDNSDSDFASHADFLAEIEQDMEEALRRRGSHAAPDAAVAQE